MPAALHEVWLRPHRAQNVAGCRRFCRFLLIEDTTKTNRKASITLHDARAKEGAIELTGPNACDGGDADASTYISIANSYCSLTKIAGKFAGGGEEIIIYENGDGTRHIAAKNLSDSDSLQAEFVCFVMK